MFSLKVSRLARHGKARINGATRRLIHATATQHLQHIHSLTENQQSVKAGVQAVCDNFPQSYWRERDQQSLDPSDFHKALADAGWLGIALPEKHGGAGLGISEACAMMQTITQSGAGMQGAQSIHANVYATQPLSIFGTDKQKREIIPRIVQGEWRTCFGVTEPDVGLDTLSLKTTATKRGDGWVINGQKIWITCAQHAKVMILLARTAAPAAGKSKADGLTLFAIPLDKAREGLTVKRITKMGARGADANEVFFDNYVVPLDTVVGGEAMEGRGFKMILHGMNAERCLIAAEALGLGYAAIEKASAYAAERHVFSRPIGQNQAVAHPLADAYMQLEAAALATYHAAALYDRSQTDKSVLATNVGVAANTAKYLAAEAAFKACERSVLAHGGMGYAAEYDVERWFRECLVNRIAPVSREMILNNVSERVLGLPRSY